MTTWIHRSIWSSTKLSDRVLLAFDLAIFGRLFVCSLVYFCGAAVFFFFDILCLKHEISYLYQLNWQNCRWKLAEKAAGVVL